MNSKCSFYISISEWAIAFLLIIFTSFSLILKLPCIDYSFLSGSKQHPKQNLINSNCCVATLLREDNFQNVLTLGYSLNHTGQQQPTSYLFKFHNLSLNKFSALQNYFIIKEPKEKKKFDELFFWSLKNCDPVIAVEGKGIFFKDLSQLCNSKPFASVAKQNDIVLFDSALMVLNPNEPLPEVSSLSHSTFSNYINEVYQNWNSLPTDLSVMDYKNDFLEFWLRYQTPTYLHYSDKTFNAAKSHLKDKEVSKGLLQLISPIVNATMNQYPNLFV